jgi:alkylation response protein AidB-like acyl-CoA dehydrogenase
MLDFSPTAEQEEIRRLAHSIAMEQLRPQARIAEQQASLSPTLAHIVAQTGLTTPYSEDYGGSGALEAITYVLIAEEFGYGDAGLALHILGAMLAPLTVALAGTPAQQAHYLPPFCREPAAHTGSLAFAEPIGGYTLADLSASAQRSGDAFLLQGTKRSVLHGQQADLRVVLVRIAGEPSQFAAFLLPEPCPGLLITPDEQKLGLLAAPSASYTFTDVLLPASALLGTPGSSAAVLRAYCLALLLRAGVQCGLSRAALEYAGEYARERRAFGRPIVSYQGIAFPIAEIAMKLDGVRLLVWQAASAWDNDASSDYLVRECEAAHTQALKLAKSATIDAVQILGGAGFLQDHPVEMWMRAAASME